MFKIKVRVNPLGPKFFDLFLFLKFKMEKKFDIRDVHKINKYMYDNGINLPKSEKTLFI